MHSDIHQGVPQSRRLRRSRRDRVFAGVCGGLAEHFDINANLLRAGFVLGTILTSGLFVPLVYVICIFVMPTADGEYAGPCAYSRDKSKARGRRKTRVGHQEQAPNMDALYSQYDDVEAKIRKLEDYVTSKEYVLKRQFEEL